ncbi:RING-7 protein [Coprinopsis sp. MPI-PUGE-AT-0042]|nr:RING-7 protein [Coprinopsis sp. MPI-PUGE-AT-0042]
MLAVIIAAAFCLAHVSAYIPAAGTNSTREAVEGGLNVTEVSKLQVTKWEGTAIADESNVSFQLAQQDSTGVSKGILVRFSEEHANNATLPTSTPWIALVSCDRNATNATMDEDIFTLARDRGAVAALLYSLDSVACVINPEYTNPAAFDQVFNIFATQSKTSSHLVNDFYPPNKTFAWYDSKALNDSYDEVTASITAGRAKSKGFVFAVLRAWNATESTVPTGGSQGDDDEDVNDHEPPSRQSTALAMIVLYTITACVSALFCVVIITGAVRAIRHPERYGPRARGDDYDGQSRARGLTRAILDTFPVIKFGSPPGAPPKDVEHPSFFASNVPLGLVSPKPEKPQSFDLASLTAKPEEQALQQVSSRDHPPKDPPGDPPTMDESTENVAVARRPSRAARKDEHDVVPSAIGRDTCPICIVDFEEGDDVRVLPCEGKHAFHQSCVDPWLLELSTSCPICRQDFIALENMISGRSDDGAHETSEFQQAQQHHNLGRFSRYVRFAVGRRHRRHDEPDPTNPYMPQAPETSIYTGM